MSKRIFFILSVALMLFLLVGCGGGSTPGSNSGPNNGPGTGTTNPGEGVVTGTERSRSVSFAYAQKPSTLDPLMAYTNASQVAWEMYYDALLYTDHSGSGYQPKLAVSWETNPDFTEWTFYLREDVFWHNGDQFDADDVVHTYEWLIEHKDESPTYLSYMPDLITAEKIDQYTVKLGFSVPSPNLGNGLTRTYIVPKKAHEELGQDLYLDDNSFGTGPWILQEWIDGQYTRWTKNSNYWDKNFNSYFDEVYMWHNTEPSSIVAGMLSGDINVYAPIAGIDVDFKPMFENSMDRLEFIQIDTSMNMYLTMRFEDSPFDDINLRYALNYAIDRQLLVDAILTQGNVATGYWHSSIPGSDSSIDLYRYDVDLAKEYMAKSNYDGRTLRLMSDAGQGKAEELCLALADMWAQVGINVSVAIEDATTSQARRNARDWDIMLGNVAIPDALPQRHLTSIMNDTSHTGYHDNVLNGFIQQFTTASNAEVRKEALFNVNHRICDEVAPHIVIANLAATHVQEKGITGVSYHPDGMTNFTWINFDPDLVD